MSGFTEDIVNLEETSKVGNLLDRGIDSVSDGAKERTAALDKLGGKVKDFVALDTLHGKLKDFAWDSVDLVNPFTKIQQNPDEDDDRMKKMEIERVESKMSVNAFFFHKWMERNDAWKFYVGVVSTRMFRFVLGHYIFDKQYQEQMISSRKALLSQSTDEPHNVPPNVSQLSVMMKNDASLRNLEYFVNTIVWTPRGKDRVFVAIVRSNDDWKVKGRAPQKLTLEEIVNQIKTATKNSEDKNSAFSYLKFVRGQHSDTHIAAFNKEVEKLNNSKTTPMEFLSITKFLD